MSDFGSYQNILKQAFEDRTRGNPSYSLRAYARDLGLAPSSLSEILRGKKGLSLKKSVHIAKVLKMPQWQTNYFCDLVVAEHSRSSSDRSAAKSRIESMAHVLNVHQVDAEKAKALTSWLDIALLEATYLKDFEPTEEFLAKKLGVTKQEVTAAKERLRQVGLLSIEPNGDWKDIYSAIEVMPDLPDEAISSAHKSLLRVLCDKLDTGSPEDRTVRSVIFSVEERHVNEAKRIFEDAIARIAALAAKSEEKKDHILCFSSQLFYLAKGAQDKGLN